MTADPLTEADVRAIVHEEKHASPSLVAGNLSVGDGSAGGDRMTPPADYPGGVA